MYGNESKGMKFPPFQAGFYNKEDGTLDLVFDVGPNMFMIYPEYIADPMVILCPSDSAMDEKIDDMHNDNGDWCVGYNANGGGECARGIDSSYAYFGWMQDQGKCGQLASSGVFPSLGVLAGLLGVTLPDEVPAQLGATLDKLVEGVLAQDASSPSTPAPCPRADEDLKVTLGYGNAGGETVYRLREGIERFLITDINNPAGSAKAQSQIYIMSDQLGTTPAAYNHIPGGANVLYMDGHVEFLKYDQCGEPPANRPIAELVGFLTAG